MLGKIYSHFGIKKIPCWYLSMLVDSHVGFKKYLRFHQLRYIPMFVLI